MYLEEGPEATRKMFWLLEVLEDARPSTRRLQNSATKSSGFVRSGAAGLLIGIECSRVRDRSCMYLISFVTIRIDVELAAVQGNYPIVL